MMEIVEIKQSSNDRENVVAAAQTAGALARKAIDELVRHYSQPIHCSSPSSMRLEYREGGGGGEDTSKPIPPVVRHHLDALLELEPQHREQQNGDNETVAAAATASSELATELIRAYPTLIRPTLFGTATAPTTSSSNIYKEGIPVLTHYELLLSEFLLERKKRRFATMATNAVASAETCACAQVVASVAETVACDITRSTCLLFDGANSKGDSDEDWKSVRTQVLLPTLIRLANRILEFRYLDCCTSDDDEKKDEDAWRRCGASMLAFGGISDPRQLDSSSSDRLCCLSQYDCLVKNSPQQPRTVDDSVTVKKDIDWNSLRLDATWWDDLDATALLASVQAFWDLRNRWKKRREETRRKPKNFATSPLIQVLAEQEAADDVTTPEDAGGLLARSEMEGMAKAVRAHFFGRDMRDEPPPQQLTRYHLGHTVTYEREAYEKPYRAIPSRLHAFVHFASLVEDCTETVLDELLPVCYELLSASTDVINAWGATVVYHFVQCSKRLTSTRMDYLWEGTRSENLLQMLDTLVKTCRDGPTLAMIGLAQRNLLLAVPQNALTQMNRRRATQQWLTVLDGNRHRSVTNTGLLCGLLAGGIVPLLYDHACWKGGVTADGMELGRPGLTAILPLLQSNPFDAHSDDFQVLALVGLLNLMVAAYPIMPRHGGKILCHLLACIRYHVDREENEGNGRENNGMLVELSYRVSAVALCLCGDRSREVLHRILSHRNEGVSGGEPSQEYDDRLQTIARTIETTADRYVQSPS